MATVRRVAERGIDTAACPLPLLILTIPNSSAAIAACLADEVATFIHDIHHAVFHQAGNRDYPCIILTHGVRERIGMVIILLWRRGIAAVGCQPVARTYIHLSARGMESDRQNSVGRQQGVLCCEMCFGS